eukprot:6773798-Alexandrium_andersonii.AAC.1
MAFRPSASARSEAVEALLGSFLEVPPAVEARLAAAEALSALPAVRLGRLAHRALLVRPDL